ncbi:hypothetical protein HYY71_02120 [Candidatus Woesearchaeota archaeon]|nr:hypothetical protein [Candidatus Woesearchaeota archaeon]
MVKKELKETATSALQTVQWHKIGHWIFLIGILVAIVAGFVAVPYLAIMLIVAGLVVGLLNITAGEVHEFLTASIALLLVGAAGLGAVALVGAAVESILKNLVVFVAPAALVVALKSIWTLAKAA